MSDLAHHRELCGCLLNADGRLVQPCAECAKAALEERTQGALREPSFMRRLADALARRLNGEWEVCGTFCRLRPHSTSRTLRLVREWLPNLNPFPRDDGPRAA